MQSEDYVENVERIATMVGDLKLAFIAVLAIVFIVAFTLKFSISSKSFSLI